MTKSRLARLLEIATLKGSLTAELKRSDNEVSPELKEQLTNGILALNDILFEALNYETTGEV